MEPLKDLFDVVVYIFGIIVLFAGAIGGIAKLWSWITRPEDGIEVKTTKNNQTEKRAAAFKVCDTYP